MAFPLPQRRPGRDKCDFCVTVPGEDDLSEFSTYWGMYREVDDDGKLEPYADIRNRFHGVLREMADRGCSSCAFLLAVINALKGHNDDIPLFADVGGMNRCVSWLHWKDISKLYIAGYHTSEWEYRFFVIDEDQPTTFRFPKGHLLQKTSSAETFATIQSW